MLEKIFIFQMFFKVDTLKTIKSSVRIFMNLTNNTDILKTSLRQTYLTQISQSFSKTKRENSIVILNFFIFALETFPLIKLLTKYYKEKTRHHLKNCWICIFSKWHLSHGSVGSDFGKMLLWSFTFPYQTISGRYYTNKINNHNNSTHSCDLSQSNHKIFQKFVRISRHAFIKLVWENLFVELKSFIHFFLIRTVFH